MAKDKSRREAVESPTRPSTDQQLAWLRSSEEVARSAVVFLNALPGSVPMAGDAERARLDLVSALTGQLVFVSEAMSAIGPAPAEEPETADGEEAGGRGEPN